MLPRGVNDILALFICNNALPWKSSYSCCRAAARQHTILDRTSLLTARRISIFGVCMSANPGGLRYACCVSGRDISACYGYTYKLCQFLSEGTLIKAMIVLMFSTQLSSVPSKIGYSRICACAGHVYIFCFDQL